jgi:hypothetical protein
MAGTGIQVKQTGRVRPANLDNGVLTAIGKHMVAEQLIRWAKGINADGNKAKPLSKKYFFLKRAYSGNTRPIRDNKMTGALVQNFQLRKANDGQIRAEPTRRLTRAHAQRAEQYENMIGFSGPEINSLFKDAQVAYGQWLQKAWFQIK